MSQCSCALDDRQHSESCVHEQEDCVPLNPLRDNVHVHKPLALVHVYMYIYTCVCLLLLATFTCVYRLITGYRMGGANCEVAK